MTLHEDIKYIESCLGQIQSVEQLRALLAQKKIELIVVIISSKFNCFEWNITQGKVFSILDLKFGLRISRIFDKSVSFETVQFEPILLKEQNWIDLDQFFEILKRTINKTLKSINMFKNE